MLSVVIHNIIYDECCSDLHEVRAEWANKKIIINDTNPLALSGLIKDHPLRAQTFLVMLYVSLKFIICKNKIKHPNY